MAFRRNWRDGAVNAAEFDAWDNRMRKQLGFFAGLSFFERHNPTKRPKRTWTLAARHWPHLLCWDWTVWWQPYCDKHWDGDRRLKLRWAPQYGSVGIDLWFGHLSLHWQNYGHMAVSGPMGADAPKIIWKHSMDTANFRARDRALTHN